MSAVKCLVKQSNLQMTGELKKSACAPRHAMVLSHFETVATSRANRRARRAGRLVRHGAQRVTQRRAQASYSGAERMPGRRGITDDQGRAELRAAGSEAGQSVQR
jgi:hypothetical protein